VVALALRSVARTAGSDALTRAWPGGPVGVGRRAAAGRPETELGVC
jgi:hypothetical protein